MAKDDRDRDAAQVRTAADDAKSGKSERDAAAKAVIDNMAKLKALRLAREAAAAASRGQEQGRSRGQAGQEIADEKTPALAAWLAGQQSGGRRT